MNDKTRQEEMWPNNGKIMLEMSDYDLNLREEHNDYSLFKNFIIVNTTHEDNLEWEKDFILGALIVSETKDRYLQNLKELSKELNLLGTTKIPLEKTNRIALTEDFDLVATEDIETFIELDKKNHTHMILNILINASKTKVVFLIMLI